MAEAHEDSRPIERGGPGNPNRGNLRRLIARIAEERGLDLRQYRLPYVERRVATRLNSLNLHTYSQYLRHLDENPTEWAKLLDSLTINVTEFFRDATVFRLFREQIVPDIIARKSRSRQRMIRVWSAGCSTGEETYSVAMCFLSEMGLRADDFILSVTGTDLDSQALGTAKAGEYDLSRLKDIPDPYRRQFLELGATTFRITPEVRNCTRFRYLNLFDDAPISVVDAIFCRNVFIYFTREQQARTLDIFMRSLAHGGYLVLGRSEKLAISVSDGFETVSGRDRVYRRK